MQKTNNNKKKKKNLKLGMVKQKFLINFNYYFWPLIKKKKNETLLQQTHIEKKSKLIKKDQKSNVKTQIEFLIK